MKKAIWVGFVLLSMLVANTGAAFAGSAVELISVANHAGGPTFIFWVNGEFSKDELQGIARVSGGDDFSLHCQQQDETTVVCHASKKIGGQSVMLTFGGATFWADVPEQRIASGGGGSTQYCYGAWANYLYSSVTVVYGPDGDPVAIGQNNPQAYGWQDYGPICQDEPGVGYPTDGWDHFVLDTSNGKAFLWFQIYGYCGQYHGSAYYPIYC